eukprot:CAMPEP_0197849002 /NCGR_PEP_ID=MMETSP1438-20131217/10590_1 /TAXON_ID=1461541 /ORGANISM="Pterosperma sp., Strain CCMP1384" /LENGTH=57 /DNA_ID=CAMNT_0043461497 /DNA_START=163 /DNA_END=333 /DNA_ORIENTATION=-
MSIKPDQIPYPRMPEFNTGFKPGDEVEFDKADLELDYNIFKLFYTTVFIVTVMMALW